jgi:FMN-dependent NADH-azoreductase
MQILHLDSSFMADASASRELSHAIVERLVAARTGARVRYRDLVNEPVPHLTGDVAAAFRNPPGASSAAASTAAEHARSEGLVTEFLDSQVIVIGAPMYNFSVASQLKAWIDRIAQPGRTFRYTSEGPVGLAGGRQVIVASTRGGMYSAGAAAGMDFQESYLKAFFGFLSITDVQFVRAERLTKGGEIRMRAMADATASVHEVVANTLAA